MGTIANVLTGVATLGIREPNNAIAEWSTTKFYQGSRSAKLYKSGSGDYGSTYFKVVPPGVTLGIYNTAVNAGAGAWDFWYYFSLITGNMLQIELRFDDPNSNGHAEVTAIPFQVGGAGVATTWTEYDLNTGPSVGGYGQKEDGTAWNAWGGGHTTLNIRDEIGTNCTVAGAADSADDWVLTHVKFELWESTPERTCYIDEITLNSVAYTVEPGGSAPGAEFGSPSTLIGYTEDGVTIEYTADTADIDVEEETFSIDRVITKEVVAVTCNMAEGSLYNIDKAMAGAVLSGSLLRLGGGVNKTMNLIITGLNPAGFTRMIQIPLCTTTGAVAMPYKKGEKTVVPVTFQALKGDSDAFQIVDNIA